MQSSLSLKLSGTYVLHSYVSPLVSYLLVNEKYLRKDFMHVSRIGTGPFTFARFSYLMINIVNIVN